MQIIIRNILIRKIVKVNEVNILWDKMALEKMPISMSLSNKENFGNLRFEKECGWILSGLTHRGMAWSRQQGHSAGKSFCVDLNIRTEAPCIVQTTPELLYSYSMLLPFLVHLTSSLTWTIATLSQLVSHYQFLLSMIRRIIILIKMIIADLCSKEPNCSPSWQERI